MLNSKIKYTNGQKSFTLNISQSYDAFWLDWDNIKLIKREIISEEMMDTMRHYYNI